MAGQKGKLVLLKVGDGQTPTESFATIGGLRTTSFNLNNQSVDATNKDSGQWRELLDGAGISSLSISGAGLFTDAASEETLRGYAFGNNIKNYELHFGNGDVLSGAFQVTSYQRSGNHNDDETYSISLESAGAVTFTVA